MLTILLALAGQSSLHVDGLRAGERFRTLPSSTEVGELDHRFGRVVDARSGFPVAGASIETWTEETSGPGQGLHLIGVARSATDGGFRVRVRASAISGDKILVRAPGYLTFPGTLIDLDLVRLMPRPAWVPRIRVVDLADRPIASARITSTYSCAHDVPAFDLRTDADGVCTLPDYGLQEHSGQLRLRASGFATRKYVSIRELPAEPRTGRATTLRLARQGSMAARVLTRTGEPLGARRLHIIDGDGYHVPHTDPIGGFYIDTSYDGRYARIHVLRHGQDDYVFSGRLPEGRIVALRVGADSWPAELPIGEISLSLPADADVPFGFFHEAGWASSSRAFPAGRVLVHIGGAFSGWEEEVVDVVLREGEEIALALTPRAEPRLRILTPAGDASRILVQAGDRSIELAGRADAVVSVPAGSDVIVLSEGLTTRRLSLPALHGDATADLRPASCLLPRSHAQRALDAPRRTLSVRIDGGAGGMLQARGVGNPIVHVRGQDEFAVDAAEGYPLLLSYTADGFASCQATVTPAQGQLTLRPARLAKLILASQSGGGLRITGPEAGTLEALHPGPLTLTLHLADGRSAQLSLELKPGEERTLMIND